MPNIPIPKPQVSNIGSNNLQAFTKPNMPNLEVAPLNLNNIGNGISSLGNSLLDYYKGVKELEVQTNTTDYLNKVGESYVDFENSLASNPNVQDYDQLYLNFQNKIATIGNELNSDILRNGSQRAKEIQMKARALMESTKIRNTVKNNVDLVNANLGHMTKTNIWQGDIVNEQDKFNIIKEQYNNLADHGAIPRDEETISALTKPLFGEVQAQDLNTLILNGNAKSMYEAIENLGNPEMYKYLSVEDKISFKRKLTQQLGVKQDKQNKEFTEVWEKDNINVTPASIQNAYDNGSISEDVYKTQVRIKQQGYPTSDFNSWDNNTYAEINKSVQTMSETIKNLNQGKGTIKEAKNNLMASYIPEEVKNMYLDQINFIDKDSYTASSLVGKDYLKQIDEAPAEFFGDTDEEILLNKSYAKQQFIVWYKAIQNKGIADRKQIDAEFRQWQTTNYIDGALMDWTANKVMGITPPEPPKRESFWEMIAGTNKRIMKSMGL